MVHIAIVLANTAISISITAITLSFNVEIPCISLKIIDDGNMSMRQTTVVEPSIWKQYHMLGIQIAITYARASGIHVMHMNLVVLVAKSGLLGKMSSSMLALRQ